MFRDLLGSIKKEVEKQTASQQEPKKQENQNQKEAPKLQPQKRNRRSGKYGRLAAWIKSNYGNSFKDGQTGDEVKAQLDKIFSELDSKGSLSSEAKRGFRTFIDTRKYDDLVKVR